MNTPFEQLQQYDTLFGFLYNINTMRQLNVDDLLKCCVDLDLALHSESSRDLDGADLCAELKIFRKIVPESVTKEIPLYHQGFISKHRDGVQNIANRSRDGRKCRKKFLQTEVYQKLFEVNHVSR
jgi:hypothetical protein